MDINEDIDRNWTVGRHVDEPNDYRAGYDIVSVVACKLVHNGVVYRLAVILYSNEYGYAREAQETLTAGYC